MGKSVLIPEPVVEKIGGLPVTLGNFPAMFQEAQRGLGNVLATWALLAPEAERQARKLVAKLQEQQDVEPATVAVFAGLLEKLSRSTMNMVKATDEAHRLLSFVSGGPDTRPDLGEASDSELIDILVEVAVQRGLWKRIQQAVEEKAA